MKIKICTKCGKEKPLSEFNKHNTHKDGLTSHCKDCIKITSRRWVINNPEKQKKKIQRFIENNPWAYHYYYLRQRCNNPKNTKYKYYGGRGIQALMTIKEIKELWFRDKAWLLKQPSIDRIDDNGNYTYENCRFIELIVNCGRSGYKLGKKVIQYDLNGNFIEEFHSCQEASNWLNGSETCIASCARGEQKTAHGFIWRYKK